MRVLWITLFAMVVDQATKVIVLQTMHRGQSIPLIGDWLKLTFTENPGMAFGITFGPKAMVTIFSLIATALIIAYLFRVRDGYLPYRASLALILGGALGNIIDRVFYGVLLGYDTYFVGRVVDFIHVNVWNGLVPDAVPLLGGMYLSLFPIWNVADMAIVCGVVGILTFQKAYHDQLMAQEQAAAYDTDGAAADAPAAPSLMTAFPAAAESEQVEEEARPRRDTPPAPPEGV